MEKRDRKLSSYSYRNRCLVKGKNIPVFSRNTSSVCHLSHVSHGCVSSHGDYQWMPRTNAKRALVKIMLYYSFRQNLLNGQYIKAQSIVESDPKVKAESGDRCDEDRDRKPLHLFQWPTEHGSVLWDHQDLTPDPFLVLHPWISIEIIQTRQIEKYSR